MAKKPEFVQVTTNLVETVDIKDLQQVDINTIPEGGKMIYEEWQCRKTERREEGKVIYGVEKQRLLRPRIKITKEQAATLNNGVLDADNTFFSFYFLAENQNI